MISACAMCFSLCTVVATFFVPLAGSITHAHPGLLVLSLNEKLHHESEVVVIRAIDAGPKPDMFSIRTWTVQVVCPLRSKRAVGTTFQLLTSMELDPRRQYLASAYRAARTARDWKCHSYPIGETELDYVKGMLELPWQDGREPPDSPDAWPAYQDGLIRRCRFFLSWAESEVDWIREDVQLSLESSLVVSGPHRREFLAKLVRPRELAVARRILQDDESSVPATRWALLLLSSSDSMQDREVVNELTGKIGAEGRFKWTGYTTLWSGWTRTAKQD